VSDDISKQLKAKQEELDRIKQKTIELELAKARAVLEAQEKELAELRKQVRIKQ